ATGHYCSDNNDHAGHQTASGHRHFSHSPDVHLTGDSPSLPSEDGAASRNQANTANSQVGSSFSLAGGGSREESLGRVRRQSRRVTAAWFRRRRTAEPPSRRSSPPSSAPAGPA